jgi:hypothetical protein
VSLEIVHVIDPNVIEMSATCHDRRVSCAMIEECHVYQMMDTMCLQLFGVREFLNVYYGYLPEGQNHKVISQCLSLINPRLIFFYHLIILEHWGSSIRDTTLVLDGNLPE